MEWVYDVEVIEEGVESPAAAVATDVPREYGAAAGRTGGGELEEPVTLSIIPGAGSCDLVLPEGKHERVVFKGKPSALQAWIDEGPYDFNSPAPRC